MLGYKRHIHNSVYFKLDKYLNQALASVKIEDDVDAHLICDTPFDNLHAVTCTNFLVRSGVDLAEIGNSVTPIEHHCARLVVFLLSSKHRVTGGQLHDKITSLEEFIETYRHVKDLLHDSLSANDTQTSESSSKINILIQLDKLMSSMDEKMLLKHIAQDSLSSHRYTLSLPDVHHEIVPHLPLLLERYVCTSNNLLLTSWAMYLYILNLITASNSVIDISEISPRQQPPSEQSQSMDVDEEPLDTYRRNDNKAKYRTISSMNLESTIQNIQKELIGLWSTAADSTTTAQSLASLVENTDDCSIPSFSIIHWPTATDDNSSALLSDIDANIVLEDMRRNLKSDEFYRQLKEKVPTFNQLNITLSPSDIIVPYSIIVQTKIEKLMNLAVHRHTYWHLYPDTYSSMTNFNIEPRHFDYFVAELMAMSQYKSPLSQFIKICRKRPATRDDASQNQSNIKIIYNWEYAMQMMLSLANEIQKSGKQLSVQQLLNRQANIPDQDNDTTLLSTDPKHNDSTDCKRKSKDKLKLQISDPQTANFFNAYNSFRQQLLERIRLILLGNGLVDKIADRLEPLMSALVPQDDKSEAMRNDVYSFIIQQTLSSQMFMGRQLQALTSSIARDYYLKILNFKIHEILAVSGVKCKYLEVIDLLQLFMQKQIFLIDDSAFYYLTVNILQPLIELIPTNKDDKEKNEK